MEAMENLNDAVIPWNYGARKTFKFGQRSRDQPRAVIWAMS